MTNTTARNLQVVVDRDRPVIKPRVLVADDDQITIQILRLIIERQGYDVVTARDGREAFEILQADAGFCAVIVDMNMPKMSGLDVLNYMKATNRLRDIPIAMITADRDSQVGKGSAAMSATLLLAKPFTIPQIKMTLEMLTRNEKI